METSQTTQTARATEGERATEAPKARVFISYKRKGLDEEVAMEVFKALGQEYQVFIDQTMPVGTHWAERIEAELRESDFLIVFLSDQSVNSQMVKGEIATAHRLAQETNGRPAILPVRLAYRDPFQYPLSAYLDPINWSFWKSHEDTPLLIQELSRAISGGELSIKTDSTKRHLLKDGEDLALQEPLPDAQPTVGKLKSFHAPNRPVDPQSDFYMVRESDLIAQRVIEEPLATITIKGPEQRGKSSLLFRTLDTAIKAGKKVVFLDFQLLDRAVLANGDLFFREFCSWISDEAGIEDKTEDYWARPRGNVQRCTQYMGNYLLQSINQTLVLAIDEIETVYDTDFGLEFFTMLRNWHERRGYPLHANWKRLNMVFVTSTEPYRLINNPLQSPFNVGEGIELEDFSIRQVAELNELHNSPLKPEEEEKLTTLLCGHPYLVRKALYMIASKRISAEGLFERATDDYGPFGDHLRYHLFELRNKEKLTNELVQIMRYNKSQDDIASHLLRGAGLVRGENADIKLRCPLYEAYFRRHLNV